MLAVALGEPTEHLGAGKKKIDEGLEHRLLSARSVNGPLSTPSCVL